MNAIQAAQAGFEYVQTLAATLLAITASLMLVAIAAEIADDSRPAGRHRTSPPMQTGCRLMNTDEV